MVGFDVPFTFLATGVLGWRARGKHRDIAVGWAGLGMGVSGLAFYLQYPAWDLQYLVDPATMPAWFGAAFLGAIMVAGIAGHWVGTHRPKWLIPAAAGIGMYGLLSVPVQIWVGDYASYHAGTAAMLPPEFIAFFALAGAPAGVGFALAYYLVTQADRSVEAAPVAAK